MLAAPLEPPAPPRALRGRVLDSAMQPLADAVVMVMAGSCPRRTAPEVAAVTAVDGTFAELEATGVSCLEVQREGFYPYKRDLGAGETVLEITMIPDPRAVFEDGCLDLCPPPFRQTTETGRSISRQELDLIPF